VESEVRRRLRVLGRVQGVGFRYWTVMRASGGLSGYVRNLPDGAVEVEVAGPAEAVERLVAALRLGPVHARVDALEELEPGGGPLPRPFTIAG
jgi:acylphosphatase